MPRDTGASSPPTAGSLLFALTILLSAFLLFQVQPIIGKAILPWFGGSPAVWTTCMLFFQLLLLAGYAYAHFSIGRVSAPRSFILHSVLLVGAVLLLPIIPSDAWKPAPGAPPVAHILLLLAASVGLPYFLLSTTGPLVQAWYYRWSGGSTPYHLYALSNVGSLGALLTYPVLVEPAWGTVRQGQIWSVGFAGFALCCIAAGWLYRRRAVAGPSYVEHTEPAETGATSASDGRASDQPAAPFASDAGRAPKAAHYLLWIALPALASVMLLAVTAHISQDIAVFPFLWILPLALYLTSFIVAFSHPVLYRPVLNAILLLATLGAMALIQHASEWNEWIEGLSNAGWLAEGVASRILLPKFMSHLWLEVAVYAAALFYLCLLCHGEVVHTKPDARHLTAFYLMIAAGGAFGGFLVAVVFPRIFHTNVELMGGWVLAVAAVFGCLGWRVIRGTRRRGVFSASLLSVVVGPMVVWGLWGHWNEKWHNPHVVDARRNFFGVLQVFEMSTGPEEYRRRELLNGRILHGVQLLAEGSKDKPTTYFSEDSGIGVSATLMRGESPLRVGTIGLGAGTIACYGQEGDYFTFYEINPEVITVSETWFSFLSDMRDRGGKVDVALGDARLTLENQKRQAFDILAIDAFTGDAIPAHLLTREAFGVYLKHVKKEGVIAVHISNRHLDLKPVVAAAADHYGMRLLQVYAYDDGEVGSAASDWLLLTFNDDFCEAAIQLYEAEEADLSIQRQVVWTDDFSSIWQIMGAE